MVMSLGMNRAELVINRTTIRKLTAGQTSPEGVTLVSATGTAAVVEIDGKQHTLSLGQSNAAVVTLRANPGGQFIVNAVINGVESRALVDTGATVVALNHNEAARLGIVWGTTRPMQFSTAGGVRYGYPATAATMQVGGIGLANVPVVVMEGGAEQLSITLLGMSFLRHVDMFRSGDTMTLTQRQ
jgi:aspartyl protease family protein